MFLDAFFDDFCSIWVPKGTKRVSFWSDFGDFFVIFRKTADMRSAAAGSIGLRVGPPRMAPFLMFFVIVFEGKF